MGGTATDLIPEQVTSEIQELLPHEVVESLDRYIVGQEEAKRAVAIALRNRWRRQHVPSPLREEITPKNIIMIGPTGVGKTEISRRLAHLANAPFVKVEASKFTEVGYMGRDVESIIRDLLAAAVGLVRKEEEEKNREAAQQVVEERLLDLLLPGTAAGGGARRDSRAEVEREDVIFQDPSGVGHLPSEERGSTREKLREMLRQGRLDTRIVEVEVTKQVTAQMQVLSPQGASDLEDQLRDAFSSFMPKQTERRRVNVKEARDLLLADAQDSLIDEAKVSAQAIERAQYSGIVFIDEIDKICSKGDAGRGPDVSREGVQRDLLPLVEGCTVSTRYGQVKTDHILFIASGAFHVSKPSDLMPEFQGRFPIRVNLRSLTPEDFKRILVEPKNALTKQYTELLKTEGVSLHFSDEAVDELAELTAEVNRQTEDIGARRLHTLLEKLLEEISFNAHKRRGETIELTRADVREALGDIVENKDLSRFIL